MSIFYICSIWRFFIRPQREFVDGGPMPYLVLSLKDLNFIYEYSYEDFE